MLELSVDPAIARAAHVLDTLSLDEDERELYEARLKWLRDEVGAIEKVRLESLAEGEAIGLGKGEAMRAKKVAIWMLNRGSFLIEEIARATS